VFDAYQEHFDHVAGSASEQQNAYSRSRMEFDNGMRGVNDLTRAGLFVVVVSGPVYCGRTDALIGTAYHPVSVFRKRADAVAEVLATYTEWESHGAQECDCEVFPRERREPLWTPQEADLPF
jgi:hypothetical protein